MQGKLLGLRRQRREEHAGGAEERAEKEARREQAAGVQAGQPLRMAEQVHVGGKTGSHALQRYIPLTFKHRETRRIRSVSFFTSLLNWMESKWHMAPPHKDGMHDTGKRKLWTRNVFTDKGRAALTDRVETVGGRVGVSGTDPAQMPDY
jgi:hypothetical protein